MSERIDYLRAALEAKARRYPQYRPRVLEMKPGVMLHAFRKHGFTYIPRGAEVLMMRRHNDDPRIGTSVFSTYTPDKSDEIASFFAVDNDWVKEADE